MISSNGREIMRNPSTVIIIYCLYCMRMSIPAFSCSWQRPGCRKHQICWQGDKSQHKSAVIAPVQSPEISRVSKGLEWLEDQNIHWIERIGRIHWSRVGTLNKQRQPFPKTQDEFKRMHGHLYSPWPGKILYVYPKVDPEPAKSDEICAATAVELFKPLNLFGTSYYCHLLQYLSISIIFVPLLHFPASSLCLA